MTKPARNEKEIERIKNLILNNALDILVNDGFSQMTMRKIASRSDMSATNIYNFFSNKDEIYLSLVARGFRKLHSQFQAVIDGHTDPLKRGEELIRSYFTFAFEDRHYYEIMFTRSTPKYNDYVGTPMEKLAAVEMDYSMKIVAITAGAIRDVMAPGRDISEEELSMKVMQIWGLLHGIASLYHSNIAQYIVSDHSTVITTLVADIVDVVKSR